MKNRPFSQSTGRKKVQKIILVIIGLFLIAFTFGIYLYTDITKSKEWNVEETEKVIIGQTPIVDVENVERFHGDEAYHVVYGTNENAEQMIIFYPLEGKEKNITSIKEAEMYAKNKLYHQWISSCENCQLIKITPAIKENTILWEMTYYDENNNYVLDYYSAHDGSSYEQFRLKDMYNE